MNLASLGRVLERVVHNREDRPLDGIEGSVDQSWPERAYAKANLPPARQRFHAADGVPDGTPAGYRDGHESQRTVTYGSHPISVCRPRVRASDERFRSQILPPYRRRLAQIDKTLHELWIQGLSTRDFEPSLRALLGEHAPLSPSAISRVNKQFHDEYQTWCRRPLTNEFVYVWADGVYLGTGPADERRVMLVVIGVDLNGDKALLAIEDAFAESEESWAAVFDSLYKRGSKTSRY